MMAPMILRTLDKVDQALARLQDLQSSIATTRQNLETNGSSERLKTSRRSRSPRIDCHQFLGGCRKLAQCTEVFHTKEEAVPVVSANWRQWSAPAEIVHQAISEILVASRFAKEMATLLTLSVERQTEQENQEKSLPIDICESEKPCIESKDRGRLARKFKVVLPMQGPAGKKEISDDIQIATKECTQTFIDRTSSFDNHTESLVVEGSNSWHSTSLKEETLKVPMEATKIKTAQKLWKISFPSEAVMFPNQTFAPSSPPSSPSLSKTSTHLNPHGNALYSTSRRKHLGPKQSQSTSRCNIHQRPLSVSKLRSSPVKSVSTKVDMTLPTRRKTGAIGNKVTSTSAVSGITRQPKNCGELPASSEMKKLTKASSLSSSSRKRHGLSSLQSVIQHDTPSSSLRLLKMKILDTSEEQVVREQQKRGWEKKVMDRRPRASVPVKDKENLELQGCTPAALCLKRNWFVGNDRVLGLMKSNIGGH
ncbi:hypothetical protein O6H91_03G126200 [Diphasiastrum complanatum]|uniref:Uncharacterized protein n=1 Tax=Diphasiastrum complanatum TaxID=34168 RepID=A0ACC2EBQ1_DIPCM|nr:hypothetical protein O6H91_03G126200 [Diphasiastrum complanatum]